MLSNSLAINIARNLIAIFPTYNVEEQYGFDPIQALVITYHEIMWEILLELESSNLIVRPEILSIHMQHRKMLLIYYSWFDPVNE